MHMARTDGRLVALVPFRRTARGLEFLARVEICPAHFPKDTAKAAMQARRYSITGGVKAGETFAQTAVRELLEEAGYAVSDEALIDLGQVYPSKQEDTLAQLYSVDLTNETQAEIKGDGTVWEEGAGVEWLPYRDGLQVIDPVFVTAMVRVHDQQQGEQ